MIHAFESLMLRVLLVPLVAALQLFALYVVFHGHFSPGGGFQGGVLLGCSIILPMLVHGHGRGFVALSERGALVLAALGVMIFTAIGAVPLLLGAALLDYGAWPIENWPVPMRRSLGILGIEVGVTLTVAGVMVSLFYSLCADFEEVRP